MVRQNRGLDLISNASAKGDQPHAGFEVARGCRGVPVHRVHYLCNGVINGHLQSHPIVNLTGLQNPYRFAGGYFGSSRVRRAVGVHGHDGQRVAECPVHAANIDGVSYCRRCALPPVPEATLRFQRASTVHVSAAAADLARCHRLPSACMHIAAMSPRTRTGSRSQDERIWISSRLRCRNRPQFCTQPGRQVPELVHSQLVKSHRPRVCKPRAHHAVKQGRIRVHL